jgi:hypothetical protein
MIYEYWSNKDYWHSELIFVCEANTILEADKKFQNATGQKPEIGYIGCVPRKFGGGDLTT